MKAIFNYRYWVLFALAFILTVGLMAVPADNNMGIVPFMAAVIGSKIIALAALFLFCLLYVKWKDEGTISELVEFNDILMRDE